MAPPNQIMIAAPQPDWIQKLFKVLSIIQLIACASLVMVSSLWIPIYGFNSTHYSGIGLIFGINGAIGLSVAKEPSKCNLIALVVMSIVSLLCSLILISQGGMIGLFSVP